MLETGDAEVHDISGYNLTFSKMNSIYEELVRGECYVAAKANIDLYYTTTKSASGIIQTFQLKNVDDQFAYRYEKLKAVRLEALSLVEPGMSDVEKALVLHDFIMRKTYYSQGTASHAVVGPLVYGYAVCSGYTNAYQFLLHEVGIESYFLSSKPMNHSWLMIKLDGEFYHADLTWDDFKGGRHCYFLCNDTEFRNHEVQNHYDWVSYEIDATSTSKRFENWFVHDVKGEMVYLDGYWYFAEGNVVKMATIDGTVMKVVATESGDVTIREGKDGLVYYTADGITKSTR